MVRLMIVEDEENTRRGLRQFVPWGELGVSEICEAEDGLEALKVFAEENPDLILSDVRMPRMNGLEFARRIHECAPDCKIIFLSGFSDKEYLKAAIKLGAVDYIEKPLVMSELKAVVRRAVEEIDRLRRRREEPREAATP